MTMISLNSLPGLDCGACGFRTCSAFGESLPARPELLKRCIYLAAGEAPGPPPPDARLAVWNDASEALPKAPVRSPETGSVAVCGEWRDSLGRDFDFYLEHFPDDPGPREIILPRNPLITREMGVRPGDVLIGRPLGMSCGCPITHCGVAMQVDERSGVIVWCVTGPLRPRAEGYKDLGYYSAEGYEGLVRRTRCELRIGMRYFFQPAMCMLQWRHSGLVNYLNRTGDAVQVRLEGLWIG
jgi:uncharacterized Fe-S cluster-containing protein